MHVGSPQPQYPVPVNVGPISDSTLLVAAIGSAVLALVGVLEVLSHLTLTPEEHEVLAAARTGKGST